MSGKIKSYRMALLQKLKTAVHNGQKDVAEILIQKLREVATRGQVDEKNKPSD